MRNARVEYEDTKRKLLTVFQFRDGQVADRYRYVEEYGDKPLTFKKVTRGATSDVTLRPNVSSRRLARTSAREGVCSMETSSCHLSWMKVEMAG